MEWKSLFASHILERGYDYYMDGAVVDMEISENSIDAQVSGYDLYDVEIVFDNDEIEEMYCSCPYAEGGKNCKHMAAVLFEYDNKDEYNESNETIEDMVNSADESVIRNFLTEILENNERLYIKFKNTVLRHSGKSDISSLKNEINYIVSANSDEGGFIDYRSAWDFCSELMDFIIDNVKPLMEKGYLEETFDLIMYIFKTISDIEIDDSDGGTSMVTNLCCDILKTVISRSDLNMKEKFYSLLIEQNKGNLMDFFEDMVEDILIDEFSEEEFVIKNLEFTDKKLKEAEKDEEEWGSNYRAGVWFERHIRLMDTNGSDFNDKINYCKAHWKLSKARKFYIDEYINRKEYIKAIDALNESIKLDEDYSGLISDHMYKLMDIYKAIGDNEKYISVLWELTVQLGNINLYKELKNQYTDEEWAEKREILFSQVKNRFIVAEFYKEEKLYDRLLNYVVRSNGLFEADKYKNILSKIYPDEILVKYKNELENMAKYTADRKVYREWVYILRQMRKIKGGNKVVNEIINDWKVTYKRRKAMMEELDRL